ncbi:cysteine hydrolase family protein [Thermofilum pendens]|uniref:Isochorismatase hydrolase n=1 Tax=Thermofilum pendens (strain DSM 2475 / Hrk 5) TaxID=368408 RepID=A1RWD5_THEPD|nr:isochorismatase family cysteine hydrolase [Thermofilum pendens]ABL77515.1 isochorismatase hydrolase [Thermofilum pendens Hrk 5]
MPKYAVLVIDMLEEFVRGRLRAENAEKIVKPIKRLIDFAHETGIPVIHAVDQHYPDVDFEFRLWGAHAVRGAAESKIVEELAPSEKDFVVPKRRYDAFMFTDLDMLLRELGVTTLIVTGIHTHICVQQTVLGAFYRGYSVIVPLECVAAFNDTWHKIGLDYMKNYANATLMNLDELLEKLSREVHTKQ